MLSTLKTVITAWNRIHIGQESKELFAKLHMFYRMQWSLQTSSLFFKFEQRAQQ